MIEFLIKVNNELINKYKDNPEALERQMIISGLLKQKNCFFKIPVDTAYNILRDLEITNYEETYLNIISYNEYIKD